MTQVGIYQRVPVYADVTLEPNSILYVPVGRDRMRTYERRRTRELASTTGSRTPSFPVEPAGTASVDEGIVGTAGSLVPTTVGSTDVFTPVTTPERPHRTKIESVPLPRRSDGIWLEFAGARWYSAGAVAHYTPDRFATVGEYRGFPVYRDRAGNSDQIWIPVVADGPLAPYAKR
jgi:hypothetical protein